MASLALKIGYTGEIFPVYNIDLKVVKTRDLLFAFYEHEDCNNMYFTAIDKNNQPIVDCENLVSTLSEIGFQDNDAITLTRIVGDTGGSGYLCDFSVEYIDIGNTGKITIIPKYMID